MTQEEYLAELERRKGMTDAGEYAEDGRLMTRELREKERSRTCLKRTSAGTWCVLHHVHKGECKGLAPKYGPMPPPPDRKLMASFRQELSEKYDDKERTTFWVDRFGVTIEPGISPARRWEIRAMQRID